MTDKSSAGADQQNHELAVVADFLRECLPFNDLPNDYFDSIVTQFEISYYRRGHEFHSNSPDSGLRIVRTRTRENKIPWLGDVPGLEWLFKNHRTQNQSTDLYFFVTPRMVPIDTDGALR